MRLKEITALSWAGARGVLLEGRRSETTCKVTDAWPRARDHRAGPACLRKAFLPGVPSDKHSGRPGFQAGQKPYCGIGRGLRIVALRLVWQKRPVITPTYGMKGQWSPGRLLHSNRRGKRPVTGWPERAKKKAASHVTRRARDRLPRGARGRDNPVRTGGHLNHPLGANLPFRQGARPPLLEKTPRPQNVGGGEGVAAVLVARSAFGRRRSVGSNPAAPRGPTRQKSWRGMRFESSSGQERAMAVGVRGHPLNGWLGVETGPRGQVDP